MCKLIRKTKRKSFTGYKIALKIGGKYYSPFSGITYKPGPVPVARKPRKYAFNGHVLNPGEYFYLESFHGKTQVCKTLVITKGNMKIMANDFGKQLNKNLYKQPLVILEMKISGEIWESHWAGDSTFAGTHIDSMEEVK